MTRDEAIRSVAWQAIANAIDGEIEWESYPGVGEDDWAEIERTITHMVDSIKPIHLPFREAYDLLASEADHDL